MIYYETYKSIKNTYYKEFADKPVPVREALIFKKTMEEMPIQIKKTDFIAGWYGSDTECKNPVLQNRDFSKHTVFSDADLALKDKLQNSFCISANYNPAHTCIDYKTVIEKGLVHYLGLIENEMAQEDKNTEKYTFLQAMQISIQSVSVYMKRFADLALDMLKGATDDDDKERLMRIYTALQKVPMHSADDIFEAVQSVWIMHSLVPMSEKCWASISLGRLDQYLYPYYLNAVKIGVKKGLIINYLKNLFLLLDSYGDGACALNIGGMDQEGRDQMNKLSELIIDVEKQMRLRAPILAARISKKTPEKILDKLIDIDLFQIGQPTFYGEETCRWALLNRGLAEEEAIDFSVNSCMGLMLAGKETADMWGSLFNMHFPLELAVNNGKPLFGELPFELYTKPVQKPESIEQVFELYRSYLKELLKPALRINHLSALNFAYNSPNPLLSALTSGCIKRGLDRAIGSEYQTITIEAMGMINTGNAISAINTLVFKNKKYTFKELIQAARHDYSGYEDLRADIKQCEKYGTDSLEADGFCSRLVDILSEICKGFEYDNVKYLPSLHTIDANVSYGRGLYTTLDGRLKGEPVNKNAGPTNDVRKAEPTEMILSAAALHQYKFSGGQPIDIYFDKNHLDSYEKRKKIAALIKTYFNLGGMQLQVNSIDSHTLELAYNHPEDYGYLIVRIGGYSARFCDMARISQVEMIDRIKHEEGLK